MSGLWPHQTRGIAVLRHLSRQHRRILIVAPCGAGKTRFANEVCIGAAGRGNRLLFVVHTQELLLQSYKTFVDAGLRVGVIQGDRPTDPDAPIQIGMSQTLQRRDIGQYTIIVIDEAHLHVDTQAIERILAANPNAFVYGLTASPWRLDSRPMGRIYQAIMQLATPSELLAQRILVPHRCFGPPGPDLSKVAIVNGDYHQAQLEAVCNTAEVTGDVASTFVQHRRPDGRYPSTLLFATSVAHSIECRNALRVLGVRSEHVDGDTPDAQRGDLIRQLCDREIDVLCNVQILTTGFDYRGLECISMARPTQSLALFLQCLDSKTEVLTKRGFVGPDDIREDDVVAALDINTDAIEWKNVLSITDRPLDPDEEMLSATGPGLDIRVTGGHRMIHKTTTTRREGAGVWTGWSFTTAQELSSLKTAKKIRLPVAGYQSAPGVDLTDAELRFLGWFMTDGSLHHKTNTITISQAEHQPQIVDLKKCLEECGFKYGTYRPKNRGGVFPNAKPIVYFGVSKGMPRGRDKHLSGWARLERYIDKDFPSTLENLNERQLAVLLEAIHLGDGAKPNKNNPWIQKTYAIASVRRLFVDRLQSLCVRRGWRCNVSTIPAKPGRKTQYCLRIKKQSYHCIAGDIGSEKDPGRTALRVTESISMERVWCVENSLGTIVTRRNGKVVIVGNCTGRVLRASPETGKTEALILDHVGNIMRHGFPLADREWDLEQAKKRAKLAEALPTLRTCPTCFAIFYTAPVCPECGHVFPVNVREIETRAGELSEIKVAYTREQREVEFQRICRVAITARLGRRFVSKTYTKQFGMRPVGFTWPKELPENRAQKRSELEHVARMRGYPSGWVDKAMGEKR